jgi:hypothetical protein
MKPVRFTRNLFAAGKVNSGSDKQSRQTGNNDHRDQASAEKASFSSQSIGPTYIFHDAAA